MAQKLIGLAEEATSQEILTDVQQIIDALDDIGESPKLQTIINYLANTTYGLNAIKAKINNVGTTTAQRLRFIAAQEFYSTSSTTFTVSGCGVLRIMDNDESGNNYRAFLTIDGVNTYKKAFTDPDPSLTATALCDKTYAGRKSGLIPFKTGFSIRFSQLDPARIAIAYWLYE